MPRDLDNMYRFAQGVAREERGKGVNIWLGPMVNIARVPFGGRCVRGSRRVLASCSAVMILTQALHHVRMQEL
jgi:hypothetical protein